MIGSVDRQCVCREPHRVNTGSVPAIQVFSLSLSLSLSLSQSNGRRYEAGLLNKPARARTQRPAPEKASTFQQAPLDHQLQPV